MEKKRRLRWIKRGEKKYIRLMCGKLKVNVERIRFPFPSEVSCIFTQQNELNSGRKRGEALNSAPFRGFRKFESHIIGLARVQFEWLMEFSKSNLNWLEKLWLDHP